MQARAHPPTSAATNETPSVAPPDPGGISADLLAKYWRKESASAAKRMASRLGIRCVAGLYPWLAIWAGEGLAPPAKSYWKELQQDHLATEEVARLLRCDARTIRRYVLNPPDGFPPPVFDSGKPWLWRPCQVYAYISGRSVPHFRRASPLKRPYVTAAHEASSPQAKRAGTAIFNPFCSQ